MQVSKIVSSSKSASSQTLQKLFSITHASEKSKAPNLICSPFNIATCLSMLADGCSGAVREELIKFFSFNVPPCKISLPADAEAVFKEAVAGGGQFKAAQAVFSTAAIKDTYVDSVKQNYRALAQKADFSNVAAAVTTINKFVSDSTEGAITDLLKASDIDPLTIMVLIACLYFKGKYAQQFDKTATQDLPFSVSAEKKISVPTMQSRQKKAHYLRADNKGVIALALPYQGDKLFLVIEMFADSNKTEVPESKADRIAATIDAPAGEVDVLLPRFSARSSIQYKDILSQNGCAAMFKECPPCFSGITDRPDAYISAVIHQAYVKVDEEGTVAAAATAVVMKPRCARVSAPTPKFNVDHPFSFSIVHGPTKLALFTGAITDPSVSA